MTAVPIQCMSTPPKRATACHWSPTGISYEDDDGGCTCRPIRLTKAQHRVLCEIADAPEKSKRGGEIHPLTWGKLLELRLIEECPRMFYGPREWRFKLTRAGESAAQFRGTTQATEGETKR